ncbi:hypothetical protein [Gordonia rhizosphera]|uniref:Transmembrane protein n=1 Tax=Gordonia rhizosphera NBRC 16068 TaxID=1108045 RepID=K6WYJ6_9ACTN|nr:hypothetical protein [Gordonia rhizosphera]GAB91634.1 hypothetical protein GORHZ_141_00090 [Gordonia rhizosphera NBRC 16068]
MADNNGPWGMDPEDFDRFAREATEGLRDMVGRFMASPGGRSAWSSMFTESGPRSRPQPETTGETGAGVWAVFVVDDDGGARVEQVYASEIEALRANQRNTDPRRKVRFLPYGIAVSALDEEERTDDE